MEAEALASPAPWEREKDEGLRAAVKSLWKANVAAFKELKAPLLNNCTPECDSVSCPLKNCIWTIHPNNEEANNEAVLVM